MESNLSPGTTVVLRRDRRRKWRVVSEQNGYVVIASGSAITETRRKRVLRRDIQVAS